MTVMATQLTLLGFLAALTIATGMHRITVLLYTLLLPVFYALNVKNQRVKSKKITKKLRLAIGLVC